MSGSNSGLISFSNIAPNTRIPLFYVQFDNSQAGANQTPQRALLLGQTILSQPAYPAFVPDLKTAINLYGAGSMLARMYGAYRKNDTFGEVQCFPLADASGAAAATGTMTLAGPATAAGTLPLYVAGQQVFVGVSAGDSATTIGTNTAAATNAKPGLPCTATAASGVVTWTAKNKGAAAGALDLRMAYAGVRGGEVVPAGVTYTFAAFSGGVTDPDLAAVGPALGNTTFDYIGMGYTGSTQLTEMSAIMSDSVGRWSPTEQLFGGVFTCKQDTSTNLLTLGGTVNDQHTTIVGVYDSPTPAFEWAAAWTGTVAPALNADPARPLQTLTINGVLAPPPHSRFTNTVAQSLLTTGIALPAFADDGTASVMRCVTTYQDNSLGQADQSYLDAETLYTLMAITRQLKSAITQKFPRSKLADNGTPIGPGQAIVTPNIIFAEICSQYALMMTAGLVENAAAMAAATFVVRNINDPSRVDILFAPYLISGMRIAAVLNQFRLSAA